MNETNALQLSSMQITFINAHIYNFIKAYYILQIFCAQSVTSFLHYLNVDVVFAVLDGVDVGVQD